MKDKNRVPKYYKEGTEDFNAKYNMLLDDGITCSSCKHSERCSLLFGQNLESTSCQFYPNKFSAKKNN